MTDTPKAPRRPAADAPIVFFDGVCNLCNAGVDFILRHERYPALRFAPLQSHAAGRHLGPRGVDPSRLESIVLLEDDRVYERSEAALRIARHLRAPWSGLSVLSILPVRLRDWLYDLVARNRYRWFGRRNACRLPTPELAARFLDA